MVTPGLCFRGEDAESLRRRRETMLRARQQDPERWIKPEALLKLQKDADLARAERDDARRLADGLRRQNASGVPAAAGDPCRALGEENARLRKWWDRFFAISMGLTDTRSIGTSQT